MVKLKRQQSKKFVAEKCHIVWNFRLQKTQIINLLCKCSYAKTSNFLAFIQAYKQGKLVTAAQQKTVSTTESPWSNLRRRRA